MKRFFIFLAIATTCVAWAKEIKERLYEDYYFNQPKSEINLVGFKKINGAIYKISGDVYETEGPDNSRLIMKFKDDKLVFTTLYKQKRNVNFNDLIKHPESKNKTIVAKGYMKDLKTGKERVYSRVDLPLTSYKDDLARLFFSFYANKTDQAVMINTSFIEELKKDEFRSITRMAICSTYNAEACDTCEYIQGADMKTDCELFETYHPVK